jgi:hypothetical protein
MDHDDEAMRLPDPNADKANAQHGRSLENLLANKNKRLQEELTNLRVANEEFSTINEDLTARLQFVQVETSRLKTLNEKLENDLMRVDNAAGKSVYGGAGSQWGGGSVWNGRVSSPGEADDADISSEVGSADGHATPAKLKGLAGLDLGRKTTVSQSARSNTNPI